MYRRDGGADGEGQLAWGGEYALWERLSCGGVVEAVEWAEDGAGSLLVAAVRNDHRLHTYRGATLQHATVNLNENGDDHVSFTALVLTASPCRTQLAVHTDSGCILVLCLRTGRHVWRLQGAAGDGYNRPTQAWHSSGRYIYATTTEALGPILVWAVASPSAQPVARLTGHTKLVRDLHPHPDDDRLASCGYDRTVRVWEPPAPEGAS